VHVYHTFNWSVPDYITQEQLNQIELTTVTVIINFNKAFYCVMHVKN
jgi:hypothetical protein